MEQVTKVFFDPLATTKDQIRAILRTLPEGSAHPFSPERLLLCHTKNRIEEIDISSYENDYFFNALDLNELGETIQTRMSAFQDYIGLFNDEYVIQQAPAATFKVPLLFNQITIFAVSARSPTYYDLCLADAENNTCCFGATDTFSGIKHSGDINKGGDLLQHFKFEERLSSNNAYAVFVSGYNYNELTRFREHNPVVLIANHTDKLLYIVPVPLDRASIGDATICSPLVIKRDGDSLICSILPTPATDEKKMCSGSTLQSDSFKEAIQRANFNVSILPPTPIISDLPPTASTNDSNLNFVPGDVSTKKIAVLATHGTSLPSLVQLELIQLIRFGSGINFESQLSNKNTNENKSDVILPCIFGSRLEGPMLLATGAVSSNMPFTDEIALRTYYEQLKSVVVVVNDQMTDNARNVATPWRINALFIVQVTVDKEPTPGEISSLLDSVNINAVTALAGPQSLILIHVSGNYYFYRGIANRKVLDTSALSFGLDITAIIKSIPLENILDPRTERLVNLSEANLCILPSSGQTVKSQDLKKFFEQLSLSHIDDLDHDISALVPQLQVLLDQTQLTELSRELISILSLKVDKATAPLRTAYIKFLTQEYKATDPDLVKQKSQMLGEYRKATKQLQKSLTSIITHLSNILSSQTTSRRTYDLKRLMRQTAIQNNIAAVQNMTFETLAGFLETYAGEMGVLLLNIETTPYTQLLSNLKSTSLDVSPCCDLDSRVLFLEGFDAGIIMEQSQLSHEGPLKHQLGPTHPILALPYLSQERGTGSMLAWVCWDEFVELDNPFKVRWMEKCNDSHIAALRIIMRDTLSRAVASREFDLEPGAKETGQLMAALLMGAMSKLAAMRTTIPVVTEKAEDTVTKLMRGLFGNLLTTAGSGVRPMSMVWQLFVSDPNFDVPSTEADWRWYEHVVSMYPYSGWPREQFLLSLEKLLNKVLIRVVTKNENTDELKADRAATLVNFCKLRNIQLQHSRTIITIFARMLTEEVDRKAIAERLLNALPKELEKESESYTRMMKYLKHMSKGGKRRVDDDRIAAGVYTKRSAIFGALKEKIKKACEAKDIDQAKTLCQKLLAEQANIAKLWGIKSDRFHMQNMNAYKGLLETPSGNDIDDSTKAKIKGLCRQIINDAEPNRVPWQVGQKGQFGDDIEPLDESFVHEIMTGEKGVKVKPAPSQATLQSVTKTPPIGLAQFSSIVKREFITQMEASLSPSDVCKITGVPISTMQVFVKTLNPNFEWERLGTSFKSEVISLLRNRKDREASYPTRRFLDMPIES